MRPIEAPFIRCQDDAVTSQEIGSLESPPCSVADGQNPNCTPLFINLIDDPIDVGLLAVRQMPQLSFQLLALRGCGGGCSWTIAPRGRFGRAASRFRRCTCQGLANVLFTFARERNRNASGESGSTHSFGVVMSFLMDVGRIRLVGHRRRTISAQPDFPQSIGVRSPGSSPAGFRVSGMSDNLQKVRQLRRAIRGNRLYRMALSMDWLTMA